MEIFTINTKDLLDCIIVKISLGSYAAILAGRMEEVHVSTSKSTLWALLFMVPYMMVEQFLNQSSRLLYGSNLTLSFIAVSITTYSFKIIPSVWVSCECSFLNHKYIALLISSYFPIFTVLCGAEMFTASHNFMISLTLWLSL
jgi:hypothetical protein